MAVTELKHGQLVRVGPFDAKLPDTYLCTVYEFKNEFRLRGIDNQTHVWRAKLNRDDAYVTSTGRDIAYPSEQELFEFQLSKLQSQDTD